MSTFFQNLPEAPVHSHAIEGLRPGPMMCIKKPEIRHMRDTDTRRDVEAFHWLAPSA